MVLNQNLCAEQLPYACEPDTRLLLGTRYVLLRREFLIWNKQHRVIPKIARRVLVTLGGGDPENNTLKVIRALQEVDIPDLEITVVVGASNAHTDVLEEAVKQSCIPIRLWRDVKNMPELMAAADMAVSGGGSTAWELLFMGTPSLFMIVAENQRRIAEPIGSQRVGRNLGQAEDVSAESLAEAITTLAQDVNSRAEINQKARQVVDGRGARRVIRSMQEEKNRGYPMRLKTETTYTNQFSGNQRGLKVVFVGGNQAGCVGLLTAIAAGCRIQGTVAYDNIIENLAINMKLLTFNSVKQPEVEKLLGESDLLISVHGREIISKGLLDLPRLGGINVHPCLYRYKGINPVGRLLSDGCSKASVGVHRMTENVDQGEVLVEEFVDVSGKRSVDEIYNVLYPYYSIALLKALKVLNCCVQ
jgi:folate-dependent phosphoribosylglycinamide formyltransferase PurN